MTDMDKRDVEPSEESFSRFQKLARALFRVEKKDVPKHEPKRRVNAGSTKRD